MKKADIDEICDTKGSKDCLKYPEYDTCDNCGRRVCEYISVGVFEVYNNRDNEELWCRYCCKKYIKNFKEIK